MSFDRLDDLLDALYTEGRRELDFEQLLAALRGLAGRTVLIQALGTWFHPPLLSARGELSAPRPAAEVVAEMSHEAFDLAEHPLLLEDTWSIRTNEHHGSYASLLLPSGTSISPGSRRRLRSWAPAGRSPGPSS